MFVLLQLGCSFHFLCHYCRCFFGSVCIVTARLQLPLPVPLLSVLLRVCLYCCSSVAASTSYAIIVGASSGLFVLLQLGCSFHFLCHYCRCFFGSVCIVAARLQLPLPMPLLSVLLRVCLYCYSSVAVIILSRILLFEPWYYLVLGSPCIVCPVLLSSGFCLGCVFF